MGRYAICLTTGVVLLTLIGLVVVLAKRWGSWVSRLVLRVLLIVGAVATYLVRLENFRSESGPEPLVVEVDGRVRVEVDVIGPCLSIFRKVGPLSFITGYDFFPGETGTVARRTHAS